MSMPETPMYKNDCVVFGENNVRFPWQVFVIHSVSEPKPPKGMSQLQLWPCRGGMDGCHSVMPLFWTLVVRHTAGECDKQYETGSPMRD